MGLIKNLRKVYFSALKIGQTGCGSDDKKCVDTGKCNSDTCECADVNAVANSASTRCGKS